MLSTPMFWVALVLIAPWILIPLYGAVYSAHLSRRWRKHPEEKPVIQGSPGADGVYGPGRQWMDWGG